MKLTEYIASIGDTEASQLFGIKERTAKSWRLGERRPRPEQAKEIVRLTRNLVKLEECF